MSVKPTSNKASTSQPPGADARRPMTHADRVAAYAGRGEPGTFRPDGSWDPSAEGRTAAYRFVQELIRAKRNGATPSDIAVAVARSPFPEILGPYAVLERWDALKHGQFWCRAPLATSAAATVARFQALAPFPPLPPDCPCTDCTEYRTLEQQLAGYATSIVGGQG